MFSGVRMLKFNQNHPINWSLATKIEVFDEFKNLKLLLLSSI
ncbi:MAG: hypothetical protein ACI815_000567 [Psychroserpens sp.]|jgi:hypothetical protein